MTKRLKCAVFMDFDNMYLCLRDQDPQAAEVFAHDPSRWLTWIETELPPPPMVESGTHRNILLKRCYLTPTRFGRHRSAFMRAGCEVVDCPSLTHQGKNSADIRMVLDIIDTLAHPTRFDEFILLSSDADFTPVLLRLRAHDRRTTTIVGGNVSPAYRGACDMLIESEEFIEGALLAGRSHATAAEGDGLFARMATALAQACAEHGRLAGLSASDDDVITVYMRFREFRESSDWLGQGSRQGLTRALVAIRPDLSFCSTEGGWHIERSNPEPLQSQGSTTNHREAVELINRLLDEHDGQVVGPLVANAITRELGPVVRASNWFGSGGFKNFIESLALNAGLHARFDPTQGGYIVRPDQMLRPMAGQSAGADAPDGDALMTNLSSLVGLPRLNPGRYPAIFETISALGPMTPFSLTWASKQVRDTLADAGTPVARSAVSFVLKGLTFQAYEFGRDNHDPSEMAALFFGNIQQLCENAGYPLDDTEQAELATMLGCAANPS